MRWALVLAVALLQPVSYPPAYPRPGATKLLENDRVIVWDITWLKQAYPIHRHPYALAGVYYTSGDRVIVSLDGTRRPVSTQSGDTAFQAAGVTHIEEGASAEPLRAVFFEMKDAEATGLKDTTPTPPPFPAGGADQFIDNDRVTGWLYEPFLDTSAAAQPHRHQRDTVAIWLEDGKPRVRYFPRGTVHADGITGINGATRAWIYELK